MPPRRWRSSYEVLEPVTDPIDALDRGAPQVHDGGNLLEVCAFARGDVDAALAGCEPRASSETFTTQRIEHAFLEPEACLAVPDERAASRSSPRVRASTTTSARSPPCSASDATGSRSSW